MYNKQINNLRLYLNKSTNRYEVRTIAPEGCLAKTLEEFQGQDDAEEWMKETEDFLQKKGE